jgi:ankyrin repeat protein
MLAARKGSLDILELLLKAGANPNLMNYRAGIYPYTSKPSLRYTPIISAASRGNRHVVAMLLANPGIKVDAQDEDGNTAMMSAARNGSLDIVELLLKAGADPNLKNNRGKTAADLTEEGPEKEPRFVAQPWLRSAIISKLQSKNQ